MLVDNSPYAYGYQVDNGIPIESWFDDDNDTGKCRLLIDYSVYVINNIFMSCCDWNRIAQIDWIFKMLAQR